MSRDPPSSGPPGPPPNRSPSAPPALRRAASFVSSLFSSPHARVDDSSPKALNSELGYANIHSLTSPHSRPHCTHDTSTCVTCADYQDCCDCSAACPTPVSVRCAAKSARFTAEVEASQLEDALLARFAPATSFLIDYPPSSPILTPGNISLPGLPAPPPPRPHRSSAFSGTLRVVCHHDNPCPNCRPGASCCVCTAPLSVSNLAAALPQRLRGGASAASSPGSASDKGFTDSDSNDNDDNTRENTSLHPAEWPKSPAQTSQPLAELELVAPAEEVETSQPALEAPMPHPKTPPNLSRLLEDIAQTPTPQRTARGSYAYPAPRDSTKGKAAR